jgi:hypothetical protein
MAPAINLTVGALKLELYRKPLGFGRDFPSKNAYFKRIDRCTIIIYIRYRPFGGGRQCEQSESLCTFGFRRMTSALITSSAS